MLRKLFVLFVFVYTIKIQSQETVFFHYGIENGLSQESVQTILKSKDGFLWLGTQDGLNRFDGDKFTVYKHTNSIKNSISGNFITNLLENKDQIWVGTSNNGVSIYNSKLDNFTQIGVKNGNCTAIEKDRFNHVFVSYYKKGLSIFTNKKGTLVQKDIPFFKDNNLIITSIRSNKDREIYVGTKSGKLFKTTTYTNDFIFKEIPLNLVVGSINHLLWDYGKLWLSTSKGVFYLEHNTINFVKLNDSQLTVNSIKKYENIYFIATDNGLYKCENFNDETNKFGKYNFFQGDKNNLNSITSNRVYDILIDNDLLWVGTNKLDLLPLQSPVFKSINTNTKPIISNNHIYSIYKDKDYLFIGTRNGLNCVNNKGETFTITKENTKSKLASNVIRSIAKKDDYLWLGTTKGITIINLTNFNPKNPKLKSFYAEENNKTSLSHNNIRNIFIDNQNRIWISTYGGGLNLFIGDITKNRFKFKHFKYDNLKNSISSDFVFNITQDADNIYWIATKFGLNKMVYSNDTPKFTNYLKQENKPNKLQSSNILTTYHDADNQMWIGTQNGLYRLDKETEIFTGFGTKEGLTNNVIYSILEDNRKNLWLSTNSGLFKLNKKKLKFTHYTIKEGITSKEFNLGAQFKDTKKNLLYFGGTKGVSYFNPNEIDRLYQESNLKFTSLNIKGKVIKPQNNPSFLKENITKTKLITLNHKDFPIYLGFSEFNFKPYKNTSFYYKLIPNDANWNLVKKGNEIQLLNLSPGEYQLQVKGKSQNKLWTKNPLQISLIVNPPWYSSNLSFFIYFLLFSALIYYIFKRIVKQKLAHQEVVRLKELNNLKTTLYTNITHEFRTPITVILGMTDSIKEKLKNKSENASKELELIERNSKNLLKLVNQILDLSKLEKGKLKLNLEQANIVTLIKYITESFSSFAEEKGISLVFYTEEDTILMDYDANKISQIVTNLLSNAIKFCNSGDKIFVHLNKKNNQLQLKIKDTGIGIEEKNLNHIFNRFYQVENSNSKNNSGTGIGLALTKELILMMNGKIQVKSKINKGTTFTILLPITQNKKITIAKNKPLIKIEKKQKQIEDKLIINTNNKNLPIALIVEDNNDVATYIVSCLETNYQISYAKNGEEGIQKAMEIIPDIIISDVMMPKKDGFELCKILKNDIKTNHIPIILLTAKTNQKDKLKGLKYGADAYLTKPFNKEELLIRIDKLIAIRKKIQKKHQNIDALIKDVKTDNFEDLFLKEVIDAIHQNIDNVDFNAKELTKYLGLSDSQLYRKIKALTNMSVAIFIRKTRLQKAKELLLKDPKLTISEVCYATGFNQPSWFSRVFKQEFGISPKGLKNTDKQ